MGVRRLFGFLLAACAALLGPGPGCLARKWWGRGPGSRRSALRDGAALPGTPRPPPPLEPPPPAPFPSSHGHPLAPRSALFPRSPPATGVPASPPAPRPGPPSRSPRARAGPCLQSSVTPHREHWDAPGIAPRASHPVLRAPRIPSVPGREDAAPCASARTTGSAARLRQGGRGGGARPNACSSAGPGGAVREARGDGGAEEGAGVTAEGGAVRAVGSERLPLNPRGIEAAADAPTGRRPGVGLARHSCAVGLGTPTPPHPSLRTSPSLKICGFLTRPHSGAPGPAAASGRGVEAGRAAVPPLLQHCGGCGASALAAVGARRKARTLGRGR